MQLVLNNRVETAIKSKPPPWRKQTSKVKMAIKGAFLIMALSFIKQTEAQLVCSQGFYYSSADVDCYLCPAGMKRFSFKFKTLIIISYRIFVHWWQLR